MAYSYPVIPIEITHSPTDWVKILSVLFASFFGALAAFSFSIFQERLKDRRQRLEGANSAVYGHLMSSITLLNLKRAFLVNFDTEFRRLADTIEKLKLNQDPPENVVRYIDIMLYSVTLQDENMSGVFQPLEEITLPMMPSSSDLKYTLNSVPDLLRFVHIANMTGKQITENIAERNQFWRGNADAAFQDSGNKTRKIKTIIFYSQMLTMRETIRKLTDTVLIVTQAALKEVNAYREAEFPKNARFAKLISRILYGQEKWVMYKIPDAWKEFMPDQEKYRGLLRSVTESDVA